MTAVIELSRERGASSGRRSRPRRARHGDPAARTPHRRARGPPGGSHDASRSVARSVLSDSGDTADRPARAGPAGPRRCSNRPLESQRRSHGRHSLPHLPDDARPVAAAAGAARGGAGRPPRLRASGRRARDLQSRRVSLALAGGAGDAADRQTPSGRGACRGRAHPGACLRSAGHGRSRLARARDSRGGRRGPAPARGVGRDARDIAGGSAARSRPDRLRFGTAKDLKAAPGARAAQARARPRAALSRRWADSSAGARSWPLRERDHAGSP